MLDRTEALVVQGRQRTYTCHVPALPATAPRSLLIALHGRKLTVEEFRWITHFDAVADRHGFMLVYPEGYGRSWNDGRDNTPAEREGVDDVAFIRTLIDHLTETMGIDPARIGVAGLSSRGRLLLFLGGVRTPARPVLSLGDTVDRWCAIDRCTQEESRSNLLPAPGKDPTHVERVRHSGGRGGTAVECWTVHGGGHTWPGGPRLPGLGRTSTRFDAGEEIWHFLAGHWSPPAARHLDDDSSDGP